MERCGTCEAEDIFRFGNILSLTTSIAAGDLKHQRTDNHLGALLDLRMSAEGVSNETRAPPLFKTALFFILKTRKRLAFYKCRCRLQIRSHDNFIEGSMKMTHYSRIDFQEGFRLPPAS